LKFSKLETIDLVDQDQLNVNNFQVFQIFDKTEIGLEKGLGLKKKLIIMKTDPENIRLLIFTD
jgi:hypothetical protein